MAKTETGTALAVVDATQYAILNPDMKDVAVAMMENLGGEQLSQFDLDQVTVPAGGGTVWQVNDKNVENLDGIIVGFARRRSYWADKGVSGDPPDCSSKDMMTGVGNPGGNCDACPFNQWGSAYNDKGEQTKGKACKETNTIFLLRAEDHIPIAIKLPPTSLKDFKNYRMKLKVPYFQVVTRLSLKKEKNADGTPFSMAVARTIGQLSPDQAAQVRAFAQQVQKAFG